MIRRCPEQNYQDEGYLIYYQKTQKRNSFGKIPCCLEICVACPYKKSMQTVIKL